MKKTGPSNVQLRKLIVELKKHANSQKSKFWKVIADELNRATRNRREVNVWAIDKNSKANETVIVPGKVLSEGDLTHKVTVAAFRFSATAKEKINANGKAITIKELLKENPKGQKVRILG